ncbi:MAG TPA: TorF family putative porin [Opitutaceae bacterium]|nr:TorF family putative porin [Opitutaceae bacterium]
MKTSSLLLAVLTFGAATVGAQTPTPSPQPAPTAAPSAPSTTWTLTPFFASQYMFRGARLGGPSFQPAIEYGANNIVLGVWSNFPIAKKVVGQSDPEIDPYGSYKIVVNDSFSVQPGFTLYTYPNAKKGNGYYKSTFEPNIAFNLSASGVTITPKLYYDTVLKGATAELNLGYSIPLKDVGTSLDLAGTYGTFKWKAFAENTSPDIKNWGDYYLVGASMPFQINATNKLTVGLAYTKGSNNFLKQGSAPRSENSAAVGRGVATVAWAISF